MDQAELRDLIPPREENPLLKRKPLNLGNKFANCKSPETFLESDNLLVDNPLTLLFFAAEWCNISKAFLQKLKSSYQEINLEAKNIEIIFVSLDKSKKQYDSFAREMPWVAIPVNDERIVGLKEFYVIKSIPSLILVDTKGEEVKNNCRQDVYTLEPDQALQKWRRLRVEQQQNTREEKDK